MSRKPVHIDLFAGAGGLSLGLENAGFQPVFVNELSPDALDTYIVNREQDFSYLRSAEFHVSDVSEMLKPKYIPQLLTRLEVEFGIREREVDLVTGGPPCQGYSGIGHRRSYAVHKAQLPSNKLYVQMAEVVRRIEPKAFLFENVRGLLTSRWTDNGIKGEVWEDVWEAFRAVKGYVIAAGLVYAKDYGVPQNRPRVLLVGIRRDLTSLKAQRRAADLDAVDLGFLPGSTAARAPGLSELLGDLVDERWENGGETRYYPSDPMSAFQARLRTTRAGLQPGAGEPLTEHQYSKHSKLVIEKFIAMQSIQLAGRGKLPQRFHTKKFSQRVLPPEWNGRGPTITATSLPDDYVHFAQPRILTVREWARLQGFPDWYQFSGKRTTGGLRRAGNPRAGIHEREIPKYTQIGNAVPVDLACAVGAHLRNLVTGG